MNKDDKENIKSFFGILGSKTFHFGLISMVLPWYCFLPLAYDIFINFGANEILAGVLVTLIFTIVIFLFLIYFSLKDFLSDSLDHYITDINSKRKCIEELNADIQSLTHEIEIIKSDTEQHLTKLTQENVLGYPWLAELYSDIAFIEENKISNYLRHKERPALKASEEIQKISKENKNLTIQLKICENQLRYYETVFPWLEEFKEVDPIETYEMINGLNNNDEYSQVKNYLSPEEYQKLSSAEKYQLALDRWKNKPNKTAWQIGIDYERYIGYVYEQKGYDVIYNGALKGLEDMGRDIIAENSKEILIIQCKYWRQEKAVHEKHIFQLYGTVILKKMETTKKVTGVFVTSTYLSQVAQKVANELKIEIKENVPFDKNYPCIKCNINRSTNEKIYHLPFDQQYDKVKIESKKGEYYARTTKEAEEKGFRHAFKHYIKESNNG